MFNQSRIGTRYRSSHLCRLSPAGNPLLRRLMPAGRAQAAGVVRSWTATKRHETPRNARSSANLQTIGSPELGQVNESRTSNVAATFHSRFRHAASRGVTHHQGSVQAPPWSCLVPIYSVLTDGSVRAQGTPLTGGAVGKKNRHLDQDRPLNSFFINVQKKGAGFAQETQQKPTGLLGGSTC